MRTSVIIFATDPLDEGFSELVDAVAGCGADAVTVAANYHHARDVLPHNPRRKIRFFQGEVFFRPAAGAFAGGLLQPPVSSEVGDPDPIDALIEEGDRRGVAVRAWTNNTHNSRLGALHPEVVVRTCFDDPLLFCLCPANPEVRRYLRTLSTELARRPIDSLLLETVCFLPFDHGWHHERSYVELSAAQKFLFGLCFCSHCRGAAASAGVDGDAVREVVRDQLERVLSGSPEALAELPLDRDAIGALAGGEMEGYLEAREETVVSLCAEIATAVRDVSEVPVVYMDVSGGLRGAGSGMNVDASSEPAPARAWQDGADLARIAEACDGIEMLGYTGDLATFASDLDAYVDRVGGASLSAALRPMPPDANSAGDVVAKLDALRGAGVEWVDFYHYAFMPRESLEWISHAVSSPAR